MIQDRNYSAYFVAREGGVPRGSFRMSGKYRTYKLESDKE
jgi:hypothetical protein